MSKIQEIQAMVASGLISDEAATQLIKVIGTKSGGKAAQNPDKLDEAGNVVERYCNLHQAYEPIEHFGNGTKKECKAGIWRWNFINRKMTVIVNDVMNPENELKLGDFKAAKEEYNELKTHRTPGGLGYNLDEDWAEYTEATKPKEDK